VKRLSAVFLCAALGACSAGEAPGSSTHDDSVGGKGGSGGSAGSKGGSGGSAAGLNVGGSSGSATGGSSGATGGSSGTSGSGGGGTAGQIGASSCVDGPKLGAPTLRLLTRSEFENTLGDIFPSVKGQWTDSLPSNLVNEYGFENDAGNVVGNQLAEALLDTALSVATAVTGNALAGILPCASAAADRACAQTFVTEYGQRLFRRPLTATETTRYLTLFDTGLAASDFPTALKWVLAGLIQSPNAVYRSELGEVMADSTRKLTGYELATELAYTFSGSTPSQDLLERLGANPGGGDPVTEAKTLLATEHGKEVVQHFFEAYLSYTRISSVVRTLPAGAPNFTDLSRDMVRETRNFVSNVVMNEGGGVRELLTSPNTYPTQRLATFYGFTNPTTDDALYPRPEGRGLGILAQGSFLSSHANTDASSPTQRGLFAYYRLLCQPKRTPPPGVPMINTAMEANTTRERYEVQHMKQGSGCAGCHLFFDPIGFGFENYDQVGVYRATQNGETVNPAAAVPDPETGEPMFTFTGEEDLVTQLAELPEVKECFAAYLATYAFGSAAACLGSSQVEAMKTNSIGIVEAFAKLAAEPHFATRNAE
jgi:hypothetical protein